MGKFNALRDFSVKVLLIILLPLFILYYTQTAQASLLHDKWDCKVGDDTYTYEITGIQMYGSGENTVSLCGFTDAGDVTENVEIPATITLSDGVYTVTKIGEGAFGAEGVQGDPFLKTITIPDTVKYIGQYAFNDCSNLETVNFGRGLVSIDAYAFNDCVNLTNVNFGSESSLREICAYSFHNCGTDALVPGVITIPDTVEDIKQDAFSYSAFCGELVIPDACIHIGADAFAGCANITSVSIGSGLTSLSNGAFRDCAGINGKLVVPDSVTDVNDKVFYGCSGITEVVLSNKLVTLGTETFSGCTALEKVNIPAGITTFGKSTFAGCSALSSIRLEEGLKKIGVLAFNGCTALTKVEFPDSLELIDTRAFDSCSGLESVTFGSKLKTVGEGAFQLCENLKSADIPDSVTKIGPYAFNKCYAMAQLRIGSGITVINKATFQRCENLTHVDIPDSISSIGNLAFYGCTSLTSLKLPAALTSIGGQAFDGCTGLTGQTLVIPSALKEAFNQSFGNRYFTKIINNSDTVLNHYSFLKPADESDFFYADATGVKSESIGKGTYVLTNIFGVHIGVPVGKTLTYNGKAQRGVITGEGYTLSGTVWAADAGSYTATATLKDGYVWSDGTNAKKLIKWKINKSKVTVKVPVGKALTYNGKVQTGVQNGGNYTLSGTVRATKAGNYTAKAILKNDKNITYMWPDKTTGSKTVKWKINKAANPLTVKAKAAIVKYSNLKIKAQAVAKKNWLTISRAQGTVTYSKSAGNANITINIKTGNITVKNGIKKGTYKVKIKVNATGNSNYNKVAKILTVSIIVK